jgi:NTP pyrophosphatase (non-canonical NTP hydrolase)
MSYPTDMDEKAAEIHANSKAKGFYEDWQHADRLEEMASEPFTHNPDSTELLRQAAESLRRNILGTKLALIASEVSEVLEALRNEDDAAEEEELADVVIRCLDYAALRGFSIDNAVRQKMFKNRGRPHMHGRKF